MINFFVTTEGRFGIASYLAQRGLEIADRVNIVTYDEMAVMRDAPIGGAIFAALDQLSPAALAAAADVARQLEAADAGVRIYNRPGDALDRYGLIQALHAAGHNRFTAIHATDDPSTLRYPVFVRYERQHIGSLTGILPDRAALDRALGDQVIRGRRLADMLIVEFCDTSSSDGLYRKYSAMRIGGAMIARHLHASPSWVAKSQSSAIDETLVREELDYVNTNPHNDWLQEVFALARIEFGRIDYGVWQDKPQAWEINTNPTFSRRMERVGGESRRDAFRTMREESRIEINRRMIEAFIALEVPGPARRTPISLDPATREELQEETRLRQRAATKSRLTSAVVDSSMVMLLKQVLRPAMTRITPAIGRLARRR